MTDVSRARIRVVLIDDHALFRAGLIGLLQRDMHIDVVFDCSTSRQLVEVLPSLAFEAAIIDLSLGDEDGIEVIRWLRQQSSSVAIVALTMHLGASFVERALAAGANAYVVKDAGPEELQRAIAAVLRGETYVCPSVTRHIERTPSQPIHPSLAEKLSMRQIEVLRLIALRLSSKEIALRLGISPKTVDAHRYQISQRLGVHDVAGMVHVALRHDLISISRQN